ncbi:hypothetical protein CC86DRAFT_146158 [Ophiobolus disseminans]|uniref:Uncharacterized protein n=1 Tax=Ophiobolus disseminans TaxID=1469910 RepID=A0A6A6ZGW6_9PLEO|nr:hypothetical protein CC86DRAFT_146158 [Ophiobolus disseminans]
MLSDEHGIGGTPFLWVFFIQFHTHFTLSLLYTTISPIQLHSPLLTSPVSMFRFQRNLLVSNGTDLFHLPQSFSTVLKHA